MYRLEILTPEYIIHLLMKTFIYKLLNCRIRLARLKADIIMLHTTIIPVKTIV